MGRPNTDNITIYNKSYIQIAIYLKNTIEDEDTDGGDRQPRRCESTTGKQTYNQHNRR